MNVLCGIMDLHYYLGKKKQKKTFALIIKLNKEILASKVNSDLFIVEYFLNFVGRLQIY